ncbi:hypothetical protein BpHYR1_047184 [Brachionus plicatilis]|uniref:Uncharacterized protein n=1 Tax=Brachionus plicatilis TaxID=10195 RepID=A0A3M7S2B3_BRAPC|nr:hypothetical protein BpHYR1_047184 [Brachionus plicatilis]
MACILLQNAEFLQSFTQYSAYALYIIKGTQRERFDRPDRHLALNFGKINEASIGSMDLSANIHFNENCDNKT